MSTKKLDGKSGVWALPKKMVRTLEDLMMNLIGKKTIESSPLETALNPMKFHRSHGTNIQFDENGYIATRKENEFNNGYVFSPDRIKPLTFVVVQVLGTNGIYSGYLAFGITDLTPDEFGVKELDHFLKNEDTFTSVRNVAGSLQAGDVLVFVMNNSGAIEMSKNNEIPKVVLRKLHHSILSYWWFFDVYGHTTQIRAFIGKAKLPEEFEENGRDVKRCDGTTEHDNLWNIGQGEISDGVGNTYSRTTSCRQDDVTTEETGNSYQAVSDLLHPATSYINEEEQTYIDILDDIRQPLTSSLSQNYVTVKKPLILRYKCVKTGKNVEFVSTNIEYSEDEDFMAGQPRSFVLENGNVTDTHDTESIDSSHRTESTEQTSFKPIELSKNEKISVFMGSESYKFVSVREKYDSTTAVCCVCMSNPSEAVLYRCGHLCTCMDCAFTIWKMKDGRCPFCRCKIEDIMRLFRA